MTTDVERAKRKYRGWTVIGVVPLENDAEALEIRSPNGTKTALVTPTTALFGLGLDCSGLGKQGES